MRRDLDLNESTIFVSVWRARSFTGAARMLGLPISTLSRKVGALERRLGVRLLERNPRRIALTEAGALYYERCARILAELERAESDVRDLRAVPRGTLRISAPPEFGLRYLESTVTRFLSTYRDMRLEVSFDPLPADLVGERYDLALRVGPLADSTLVARRIAGAARRIVASPLYLNGCSAPATPHDLGEHECLIHRAGQRVTPWRLRVGQKLVAISVRGRLVANSYGLLVAAARAGLGIAMVPARMCADDIADGRLVPLLDQYLPGETTGIYAVYPSSEHPPAKLTRFIETMLAALGSIEEV